MTDEEKVLAVTAALVGEFCVGQRVRVINPELHVHGQEGRISAITIKQRWFDVLLDGECDPRSFKNTSIEPAL